MTCSKPPTKPCVSTTSGLWRRPADARVTSARAAHRTTRALHGTIAGVDGLAPSPRKAGTPKPHSPMISVAEALARMTADLAPLPEEVIPVTEGCGRVLARDLPALLTQPPFPAS